MGGEPRSSEPQSRVFFHGSELFPCLEWIKEKSWNSFPWKSLRTLNNTTNDLRLDKIWVPLFQRNENRSWYNYENSSSFKSLWPAQYPRGVERKAVFLLWVILSISIKILIWPHMLSLRLWASRPVLICMSGLDNDWSPLQPEKKPRILLYKWDHIPPAQSWWLSLTPVLFDVWVQDTEVGVFQGSPARPQRWSVPSGRTHLSASQPHWPPQKRPFLQNASEAGQKQILGSAGILSFFIWMAFLSQCDSKTTELAITLILSMQKTGELFNRLSSSRLLLSLTQTSKRYCQVF